MLSYKNGIQLTPGEVNCLLAFTGKDPTREHLWGACFRIEEFEIVASSTNGHVAVQGTESGKHTLDADEWFIKRPDLELLKGVCKGNHLVSVHRLGFTLLEFDKETLETRELGEFTFDEPSTQLALFPSKGLDEILSRQNETAPVMRGMFAGSYMALFQHLANAAGTSGVHLSYPDDPAESLRAEASEPGDSGTTWRAAIMPMRQDEPTKFEPSEDPQNPDPLTLETTAPTEATDLRAVAKAEKAGRAGKKSGRKKAE